MNLEVEHGNLKSNKIILKFIFFSRKTFICFPRRRPKAKSVFLRLLIHEYVKDLVPIDRSIFTDSGLMFKKQWRVDIAEQWQYASYRIQHRFEEKLSKYLTNPQRLYSPSSNILRTTENQRKIKKNKQYPGEKSGL